ncbi:MAG: hypothetical protein V2I43_14610 [Parvularcula sp.]|nr:hypothetical protein [Parvularcula sp.]
MKTRRAKRLWNRAIPVVGLATCGLGTLSLGANPSEVTVGLAGASAPVSQAQMPSDLLGAWQLQVDARQFKLRDEFNIEVKFADGSDGLPEGLVAYFAGDSSRPSGLCRSQLDLVSATQDGMIFEETLNYKSGRKIRCPIWGRVSIKRTEGGFLFEWSDEGRRRKKVRMWASAGRLTGGQECRMVGATGTSDGEVWCRDAEGNWSAKRT